MEYVVFKRSSVDEKGNQALAQLISSYYELRETYCLRWTDLLTLKQALFIISYSGNPIELSSDILTIHQLRRHIKWDENPSPNMVVVTRNTPRKGGDTLFALVHLLHIDATIDLSSAKNWLPKMLSYTKQHFP